MVAMLVATGTALASPSFPEKGWHKGPYLAANVGMMQLTNDTHVVTNRKFNGTFDPSFGLTFGWDIADWIGPMLQMNFATATDQVGSATAIAPYPVTTFPIENARQYAVNLGLYCRATLPYFLSADWQGANLKFIPYLKLGGVGHALYVNAPTTNNKVGAYGGGIGFGAGAEFFVWKGIFLALDVTENIIFQKSYYKNINDNTGAPVNTKIINGGTSAQFNLQGLFGWHF